MTTATARPRRVSSTFDPASALSTIAARLVRASAMEYRSDMTSNVHRYVHLVNLTRLATAPPLRCTNALVMRDERHANA